MPLVTTLLSSHCLSWQLPTHCTIHGTHSRLSVALQDPSSAHLDGYCDSPTEPYMVSLKQGRQLKELREGPENSLQLAV